MYTCTAWCERAYRPCLPSFPPDLLLCGCTCTRRRCQRSDACAWCDGYAGMYGTGCFDMDTARNMERELTRSCPITHHSLLMPVTPSLITHARNSITHYSCPSLHHSLLMPITPSLITHANHSITHYSCGMEHELARSCPITHHSLLMPITPSLITRAHHSIAHYSCPPLHHSLLMPITPSLITHAV